MVILLSPSLSLTRRRERHDYGDGDDDEGEKEVFYGGFLRKRLMDYGLKGENLERATWKKESF